MDAALPANLATNLRRLRQARGLTQQQAARLADLPRPTWATLESGSANPTIVVLARAAAALNVPVEELIGAPRATGRLYRVQELRTRRRGAALLRDLLPEKLPGVELDRLELPPGATLTGVPHTPGTREYLACEHGTLHLATEGERFVLARGDVVVFRGDQRHSYRNPTASPAVGYSVVLLLPPGGRQ
jgi:transcriptional regulator with XRE-family HTH domain